MTRRWDESWQHLAYFAKQDPEYHLNDDLLKEIIIKMYYSNYRGLMIKKDTYEK